MFDTNVKLKSETERINVPVPHPPQEHITVVCIR